MPIFIYLFICLVDSQIPVYLFVPVTFTAGNLQKAFKFTDETLHPGNNKRSVPLALNVANGTTSAAIICYFRNETAVAGCLKLVNIWWTISNSKCKFDTDNRIGHAAIPNDRKAQVNYVRILVKSPST